MSRLFLRKYRKILVVSMLFFILGCGITMTVLQDECGDASNSLQGNPKPIIDSVEYAVLVLSGPANVLQRDAIRVTWANFANNIFIENGERLYKWNYTRSGNGFQQNLIKIYFVVGTKNLNEAKLKKLHDENLKSKDLLLLDSFEDAYYNLAIKMLHALQWFSSNFKRLKYVIKCDDDSFVRVDRIVWELEAFAPAMNTPQLSKYVTKKKDLSIYKGLYWGYFHGKARVYMEGKWEEKDWFLCDRYLPYALGGGYVISRNIVDNIAKNMDDLSSYKSEDVSMGVWTAPLSGINRVHDIRFDTQFKSFGCISDMLVRHKQTPADLMQMFRTLMYSEGKKLCKIETNTQTRNKYYYLYDWNKLPSSCCSLNKII